MFADRAKIIIKNQEKAEMVMYHSDVKNTCRTVVRTAVTEERAETLYFSWISGNQHPDRLSSQKKVCSRARTGGRQKELPRKEW